MLHILWMLIKLILILLGTVLGLAVLVLLLLLFCPVRYSAEALKETSSFKETEAAVRVSWLFRQRAFLCRLHFPGSGLFLFPFLEKAQNRNPKNAKFLSIFSLYSSESKGNASEQPAYTNCGFCSVLSDTAPRL